MHKSERPALQIRADVHALFAARRRALLDGARGNYWQGAYGSDPSDADRSAIDEEERVEAVRQRYEQRLGEILGTGRFGQFRGGGDLVADAGSAYGQ